MWRLTKLVRGRSARARALLAGILVLVLTGATAGVLIWREGRQGPDRAARAPVVALVTGSGVAVTDGDLVPMGTPLRLIFDAAMSTDTVGLLANGTRLGLRWTTDGRSAALDVGALRIGPVQLTLAPGGRDRAGYALAAWRLGISLIFGAQVHTVPLLAPALVQVPNDPGARDQAGLQSATVVYEYLTEGGITRFTALFTSAPDAVGPVRSGRLISFDLTRRYQGLLFASGLSEGSAAVLRANPVPHVFDTGGGVFSRTSGRYPPNNLFTGGEEMQRAVAGASLAPFALPMGSVPIQSGLAATTFDVPQHASAYTFDPATRTYTKQIDGRTLADAATGQPLRIQLVIAMHTTAAQTGYVEDVNGQPGLDFDLQSGGRADFAFDGVNVTGRWSSPSPGTPLRFQLDSGAVVTPPMTWIDVVTS